MPNIEIEIVSVSVIEGGVEVFARAWTGLQQIGFGADGSVDIERFRIFNPPVLVPDPLGLIIQENINTEGVVTARNLREDPQEATLQSLQHTIENVGKPNNNIFPGKVGNTTSTFYSAAGAVSPVDGFVGIQNSTSWATLRAAADGESANVTSTTIEHRNLYGNGNGANFFSIFRAFHLFDTSSIPDADVISSATLSLYGQAKSTAGTEERLYVVSATPAATSTLAIADWDQTGATSFGTTPTTFSTTAYNDVTLNASGIADITKTGITKFGVRGYYDFNNIAPDAANDMSDNYYAADQAGTSTDPMLVVEHAAAATNSNFFAFF